MSILDSRDLEEELSNPDTKEERKLWLEAWYIFCF